MPAQLTFHAKSTDSAASEVIEQVRKLNGVTSVARSSTADGVSGFVIFENAELAAAARNELTDKSVFVLSDPAREAPKGRGRGTRNAPATGSAAGNATKKSKDGSAKAMPCTADFFNGPSPSTMRREEPRRGGRGGAGRGGAGRGGGGRGGYEGATEGGGGGGRGGRGGNSNGRRGGSNHVRRSHTVQAYAVCVHNVPFSVTNDQIFQAFKSTGHIFDIRRAERIALLLMRDPQSVTDAIVNFNGKTLFDSELAVCSGGEMRLPVPQSPHSPPPPFQGEEPTQGPAVRLPVPPPVAVPQAA
jgi:hypothetical protein